MVEVTKTVAFKIDGKDVDLLSSVCELARRYIDNARRTNSSQPANYDVDEYSKEEIDTLRAFMQRVFDA